MLTIDVISDVFCPWRFAVSDRVLCSRPLAIHVSNKGVRPNHRCTASPTRLR
jgi:predicted DsbA family dithiol-disulfide isomerase